MAGRILRIARMMSIAISFVASAIFAGGFTRKWNTKILFGDDVEYVGAFNLDSDPQLEVVIIDMGSQDAIAVIDGTTGAGDSIHFYEIDINNGTPMVYVADIDNDVNGEIIVCGSYLSRQDYGWHAFDYSGFKVEEKDVNPANPTLLQNYPNPLSSATRIKYSLPKKGKVTFKIYNEAGQLVRTLVDGEKKPGEYTTLWDSRDDRGKKLASGSYFYKIETENHSSSKKMILVK